jgi:RNA polymerase-binding transcription factor DksA
MATKKKAAKPAKRPTSVKKIVPAKKAAAKPAQSSGGSKAAKKAPVSKSIAKSVAKKVAPLPPSKKPVPVPVKKPHNISKPAAGPAPKASSSPAAGAAKAPSAAAKTSTDKQPVTAPVIPAAKQAPLTAGAGKAMATPPPIVSANPASNSMSKMEPKKPVVPAKPVKVVIPEIKTKTVRKYEPEFTKSVLDTPQEEQTGPTMRYSDAELGEFRELINRKLDAAKKELAYLQGLITRKDEMGGDNDDARYMTMEDGSMSMEREQLSQMASRQITFIDHLEKAIMRIENKTYGICRVTGKLIDKARLRAVPHATLSIEAKQMMNK